ncbi:MAG TPA: hypothetical protein VIZ18_15200 [Ktedonobacteraceae bacterium]
MTRDFSKHERDDERPRSRNSSSGSQGEERSPRPARPRLNRNTVDKAWENGARQNHSDYRARDTRGGQPPRENWRGPRQSGQPSTYNGRNNNNGNSRSSYGNRSSDYRRDEHTPDRSHGSRPRPFESGMRRFDERQYNQHRDYQPRTESSDFRQREDSRYTNNRPPSRSYDDRRDDRTPRNFQRDERPRRNYENEDRPARRFEYDDRRPRDFERPERQPRRFEDRQPRPRGYYREQREQATGRPDAHNSRWQSRPQRFARKPREYERPVREREQFEGDYEQFDARATSPDVVESREITQSGKRATRKPRANQHKDAEFRTEVNQQTDSLIEHIVPVEPVHDEAAGEPTSEAAPKAKKARTARAGTASAKTTRSRKADGKSREPHLRPSKRGFKWPAPEQAEQAEQTGEE